MTSRCPHCKQALPGADGIAIDPLKGEVRHGDVSVMLSRRHFALFVYLHSRRGDVCTRESILEGVYLPVHVGLTTITAHVNRIKQEIHALPLRIKTHKGRGYSMEAA